MGLFLVDSVKLLLNTKSNQPTLCLKPPVGRSLFLMAVFLRVRRCTQPQRRGRAQVCCWSRGSSRKEIRILRTLCQDDFKLQPFPDERLSSNPVCSTGVNTYPSASKIQNVLLYSDEMTASIFPPRTNPRRSGRFPCVFNVNLSTSTVPLQHYLYKITMTKFNIHKKKRRQTIGKLCLASRAGSQSHKLHPPPLHVSL